MAQPTRILSYVVAFDDGLAPNITGGKCTLAVCKPNIRRLAVPGEDWVVGMSTAADGREKVIYAMEVGEKLPYEAYFHDPRFEAKKPIHGRNGDNFFTLQDGEHRIAFRSAAHAGKPEKIARDLHAPYVLVAKRFWYFGANAPALPEPLRNTPIALPDLRRRGHRKTADAATISQFSDWIGQWEPGIHGPHRDIVPCVDAAKGRKC